MIDITKIAIKGTTQDHLQILDIKDDLVILKDGSVALIIQVSAVNFGLLSEQEQEAIIFAYAGLLNSLNFPIQIVVRSQQKDVSAYLALLEREMAKQKNPLIANQIAKYRDFIATTVKNNNVLDKKFYVAIPFSYLELGVGSAAGGLFKKKAKDILPLPADTIIEKARTALLPKRDHILRQLGRLGLRARQLTSSELLDLFYDIYNHHIASVPSEVAGSAPAKISDITDLGSSDDRGASNSTHVKSATPLSTMAKK